MMVALAVVLLCLAWLAYVLTSKWGSQSAKGAMVAAVAFHEGNLSYMESALVTHCAYQMAVLKVEQEFPADPDRLRAISKEWWDGLRANLPAGVMVRWEKRVLASGDTPPNGMVLQRLLMEACAEFAQQN